ncbi:MAG: ABC transporter permease [Deltaproteobacteria bacterium]|nr:MAG: ABC transporter permease [Deltaproteobacteria bacterium]
MNAATRAVARLGRAPIMAYGEMMAILRLGGRVMRSIRRGNMDRAAVFEQMWIMGNKSVFYMTVTMGVIGIILIYQGGLQAQRIVPDTSMIGATYTKFLVRDLAPSIGALPLAMRIGAGIAAELGSMVVTEQVDAMRMCAADPIDYLVVPRFIASTIMTTVVLVWSAFVMTVSGMLTAYFIFDVNFHTFLNPTLMTHGDWVVGLVKAVVYGATIALISSHRGLSTFGGSAGVGWATTSAVVYSCFSIIVLNLFISLIGQLIFPA